MSWLKELLSIARAFRALVNGAQLVHRNNIMNNNTLGPLLRKTKEFQDAVLGHMGSLVPADGKRYRVASQACHLSVGHAMGILVLTEQRLFPSAYPPVSD